MEEVRVASLKLGEGFAVGDVFATALPFLIGWFATAPLTGTFGKDARVRDSPFYTPPSSTYYSASESLLSYPPKKNEPKHQLFIFTQSCARHKLFANFDTCATGRRR